MFQQVCGGGAAGLALAGKLADGMMAPVVLTSAELCSLVYQPADRSAENIVGSAIFADGAASLVMGPGETGHRLLASSSHLIPDSAEMMGYNLLNDGIHLRLARELPECLAKHTPQAISEFLKKVGTSPDKVSWWLFHPGGARILTIFAEKLGLTTQQMRWSWDVLSKYGNMSSASILYVLEAFLGDKSYQRGDKAIIVGMGPGLSLEFTLFECHA